MDYEVKRPLMRRIDNALLEHAAALGTKEGGPNIGDVYHLQGLAEIHCYLKTEHHFTPDEVTALLQFSDPLTVAMECWEERDLEKDFQICALLHTIDAYERFPLVDPAGYAQQKEERLQSLKELLERNMSDFQVALMTMDKAEIIAQSADLTAMQEAHDYMLEDFSYKPKDVDILLEMENPLKFIAEQWPFDPLGPFGIEGQIRAAVQEAGYPSPAVEKPSVRGQLHEKIRETGQHMPRTEPPKGGEVR